MSDIGARLKEARGRRSAREFAALVGCSLQTVYRCEWGVRKDIPGSEPLSQERYCTSLEQRLEKLGTREERLAEENLALNAENRRLSQEKAHILRECSELRLRLAEQGIALS